MYNLTYIAEKEAVNNKPECKIIPNININENYSLNLNNYCSDADNDELFYDYYKAENITIKIENGIATFIPDKNFVGSSFTFFKANDSIDSIVTNVFAVNVSEVKRETLMQQRAEIGKPVKWVKKVKSKEESYSVNISNAALNVTIKKIVNGNGVVLDKNEIKIKEKGVIKRLADKEKKAEFAIAEEIENETE